jgi:pimeloyl-ACP methyl ester carboxylesterase
VPEPFYAVGEFYDDFGAVPDAAVVEWLSRARLRTELAVGRARREPVGIPAGGASESGSAVSLRGDLATVPDARGLVVFAHGSGSSRLSPRNRQVAEALNAAGFDTLLMDLLTEGEASDRAYVFDIPLLASRLRAAARWADGRDELKRRPLAFFGASTGAAAALWAAADLGARVSAVVSRGGRPDLAWPRLDEVKIPVLLIVGGLDGEVVALNERARARLAGAELDIVPGATHLFEETGALEQVSSLAVRWLARRFKGGRGGRHEAA